MKRRIHVNRHNLKRNRDGKRPDKKWKMGLVPIFTVKTYKSNHQAHQVNIDGPCKLIYMPHKPLPCGATVWIETTEKVTIWKRFSTFLLSREV